MVLEFILLMKNQKERKMPLHSCDTAYLSSHLQTKPFKPARHALLDALVPVMSHRFHEL